MDSGSTTAPSEMPKHPPMTVRAQALAYQDAKVLLKTGMSMFTLSKLFQRGRKLKIDGNVASVFPISLFLESASTFSLAVTTLTG